MAGTTVLKLETYKHYHDLCIRRTLKIEKHFPYLRGRGIQ
jgi:hypothetical protein